MANALLRFVVGGPVSSQDSWSIGVNMAYDGTSGTQTGAQMNAAAAVVAGHWTGTIWKTTPGLLTQIAPATKFTTVSSYQYNTAGALIAQGQTTVTAVPGTASGQPTPAYCACVTTLQTAGFGRSFRGRWYLPLTGMTLDAAALQLNTTTAIATAVKGFIDSLNGDAWSGNDFGLPTVVVHSAKLNQLNRVFSIKVDSIPDTQRGRINKDSPLQTATATMA